MLDIAPTELLLVALVALVVIGPKDLPRVLRVVGQWVGRARGVARQFRSGFDEMVRQAEFDEMEKKWAEENVRIMREHPPQPEPAVYDAGNLADASAGSNYPYPSLGDEVDSAIDSFADRKDSPPYVMPEVGAEAPHPAPIEPTASDRDRTEPRQ
jgi:sec-independent protein translocase protein TatB